MYIYHALINALSAHMIHVNLNMIFYTHVEHSPTKTIYIKYCNGVVERRRTGHRQPGVSKNGDHSRRTAAIRFYSTAADNFQHTQNPHAHA